MSFPVKLHPPLITTRIVFKHNTLPPLPEIFPRHDFGAHIRHYSRQRSAPYNRPKHTRRMTPRSVTPRSESPLSDLPGGSDSDSDSDEAESTRRLIPKPAGEVGKSGSGGFNLERTLGWDHERYEEFTKYIQKEVANKLDVTQCFTNQKLADIDLIIKSSARKFKTENKYVNNWPIREALKARLKYTVDWEKKKEARKIAAGLQEVLNSNKKKT